MSRSPITIRSVLFPTLFALSLSAAQAGDVKISPDRVSQLEIGLSRVKPASATPSAVLPATVVPASNARITAAAPFAGTVLKVAALPGQAVRKGDPLITVLSRDLVEAHGNLAQQEAELQKAAATAKWKRDLANKKILSAAIAEEAEAARKSWKRQSRPRSGRSSIGEITLKIRAVIQSSLRPTGKWSSHRSNPGRRWTRWLRRSPSRPATNYGLRPSCPPISCNRSIPATPCKSLRHSRERFCPLVERSML